MISSLLLIEKGFLTYVAAEFIPTKAAYHGFACRRITRERIYKILDKCQIGTDVPILPLPSYFYAIQSCENYIA